MAWPYSLSVYLYCYFVLQLYCKAHHSLSPGLMPQTSYTFFIYGKNALGKGTNSVGFTATTSGKWLSPLNTVVYSALSHKEVFRIQTVHSWTL